MKQTKSVNDKAGGDAWAKMEDVAGATESMAPWRMWVEV